MNQPAGSSRLAVNNYTGDVAQITGNQFYGLSAAQVAAGANAQSGALRCRDPFTLSEYPFDWLELACEACEPRGQS